MNLFELNTRLAVKLNQSLETLYNLEYMEYSLYVNIVKKEHEELVGKNIQIDPPETKNSGISVNLPDGLKLK
jgi:hypothetical protein